MSNLAYDDNVSPIRPDLQVVENKVAELEDGYAKLSNMLLEEYAGADINKRHFKVLLAVLRLTYGWNKSMDRISDSQIAEIAKLPVKRCNEAKLELVRMNILKQHGNRFGPNKNVSEWCIPQNRGEPLKTGDKKSLKIGDSNPSKQGDTKDIIPKKERKDKNTMPEQVQAECKKTPSEPAKPNPVDEAFESTFWCAGMVKTGKKAAKSAFATQFREWRKQSGGSPIQFAQFLADDIACRKGKQFGFEKLHPATYLNGKRWEDEKPSSPAATQPTAAVFYGQNSFHADFSKL